MPKLPAVKPRDLLRALELAGFYVHRITGSHHILRHRERSALRITVPFHTKDLKRKTLASILKAAGMSVTELRDLL